LRYEGAIGKLAKNVAEKHSAKIVSDFESKKSKDE